MNPLERADTLRMEYQLNGDGTCLDQAIGLYRQALAASLSPADRIAATKSLAVSLSESLMPSPNTDEIIDLIQRVLAVTPSDDPSRLEWSYRLVKIRCTPHRRSSDPQDLDKTFDAIFQALATCTPTDPYQISKLLRASSWLREQLKLRDQRDRLVGLYEQMLALTEPGRPERPLIVRHLASTLRDRYLQHEDLEDLARAVSLYQHDLNITSPDAPDYDDCLASLAQTLMDSFRAFGNRDDVDRAIDLYRKAYETTDRLQTYTGRLQTYAASSHISAAAEAVYTRFQAFKDANDLDLAVDLFRRAYAVDRASGGWFANLLIDRAADVLADQYVSTGDPSY